MSIESPAVPLPRSRPPMTPRAKKNWITGSVTISATALISALIFGAPKVFAMLDARYVLRSEAAARWSADSTRNERMMDVLCEIKPSARACK